MARRVLLLIIGYLLLAPPAVRGKLLPPRREIGSEQYTDLALYMIRRYIQPMTNTLMVMERSSYTDKRLREFQTNILEIFVRKFDASLAIQLFFEHSDHKPWDYNVFIVDSYQAFINLRFNFPDTLHERQFFFFILYTNIIYDDVAREAVMIRIFRACRDFNVVNVVIMMPRYDRTIGFYTYCIYTPHVCDTVPKVLRINTYRNGRLDRDELFPRRMTDFYWCPLQVCVNYFYPLLDYVKSSPTPANPTLTGIDGDLLRILARALRFTIAVRQTERPHRIGTHSNSTGCFRMLEEMSADIAIGAYSINEPHSEVFTASAPYHHSMFYFLVRAGQHFGALQQLANPFSPTVWAALGGFTLAAIALIRCLLAFADAGRRDFVLGRGNHSPTTTLFSAAMGNPVARLPRRNFARFLLMSWLLITLVLRNAYQAKMFDALRTAKRVPTPRGINEMIERRFKLLALGPVDFYPENLTVQMPWVWRRMERVEESREPFAVMSLLDSVASYRRMKRRPVRLAYVNEAIYTFQSVMFFRKHSIFKAGFDRKLKQLLAAGITTHVASRHVNRHLLSLSQGSEKVAQISNGTLRGLYLIYGVLSALSALVFAVELYSRRSRRCRRLLDWVHFSGYRRRDGRPQ